MPPSSIFMPIARFSICQGVFGQIFLERGANLDIQTETDTTAPKKLWQIDRNEALRPRKG